MRGGRGAEVREVCVIWGWLVREWRIWLVD